MTIRRYFTHAATQLRPSSSADRYGNTAEDWTAPTSTSLLGWFSRQTVSVESDRGTRDEVATYPILHLPAGTTVLAADRFRVDGVVYEVDGEPYEPRTPRGAHHVEVRLRAIKG